jgi:hypothetical protein
MNDQPKKYVRCIDNGKHLGSGAQLTTNAVYEVVSERFDTFILKDSPYQWALPRFITWVPQIGDWITYGGFEKIIVPETLMGNADVVKEGWLPICGRAPTPPEGHGPMRCPTHNFRYDIHGACPHCQSEEKAVGHIGITGPVGADGLAWLSCTGPGYPKTDFYSDALAWYVGVPQSALKRPAPVTKKQPAKAKPFGGWSEGGVNTRGW